MDPVSASASAPDRTLPVNLLLKGRPCLVVGAGKVACRKVRTLVEHGASVMVVAPVVHEELRALAAGESIELRVARFDEALLSEPEPFLVYAATDDDALNREIAASAARRGILATSVSSWQVGDFISPSIIPWGEGQVSVTTEGASCRQSQFMRKRLQTLFGAERSWLLLACVSGSIAPSIPDLLEGLGHLAALEEFVLVRAEDGLRLYAWAADDDVLVAAALRILGWDAGCESVFVARGDPVVEQALREGGASFTTALEQAVAAGFAGTHLEALGRQVTEVEAHA